MIGRIFRKIITTIYKLFHWNKLKTARLYDIPRIYFLKRLNVGNNVCINNGVFIHAAGGVTIGDDCVLSAGTTILSTGENTDLWVGRDPQRDIHAETPVRIGRNVWLCANTTVCPGVEIADDSIIAAGSVVTKNLTKKGALYAGVPARYIKDLKNEQ